MDAALHNNRRDKLGVLHLDKTKRHKRNPKRQTKSNLMRNKLTAEDKKDIKYEALLPLYQMWCEYFVDLVGAREKRPDDRMLKADYHGALLMVAEADNTSMVGITGIVAMETRHTFQMVTKDDRYLVIPKQGSVFQFVLDGRVFSVFGDAMRYKPGLRGKKQRLRTSLPLFLR